jgi:hypothetical protein
MKRSDRTRRPGTLLGLAPGLLLLLGGDASASHTVFDYRVDRFEVTGQVAFADDFSDGVLAPWTEGLGTAVETGGELSLRSPGDDLPLLWWLITGFAGSPPIVDVSHANLMSAGMQVSSGSGDFEATSIWTTLPTPSGATGGFYGMSIFVPSLPAPGECELSPGSGPAVVVVRSFTLALRDFPVVPPPFAGPTGLAMGLNETVVCVFDPAVPAFNVIDQHAPEAAAVPVAPTGDVVLRMTWDDTLGMMTPSYSVDSGATFMTPFAARPVSFANARFRLIGDPVGATEVPSLGWTARLLLALGILLAGAIGARLPPPRRSSRR